MPHSYKIFENGNLVIEKWRGVITGEELIGHNRDQMMDERINRGAVKLADTRGAKFPLKPADIYEIIKIYRRKENRTFIPKFAMLLETHFALASLFEKLTRTVGMTVVMFSPLSFDACCQWLGYPREEIQKYLDEIEVGDDQDLYSSTS